MCGICGVINFNRQDVADFEIRSMMTSMKHRGPDDKGIFIDKNIGFGFVRLSIIDLSPLGHQPMFDELNQYMIIYNGEVYNYIELRKLLKKKGYSFKSDTDTEVVLKAYLEWGEECQSRFNGMWAFCIYDLHKRELFISRDRYGIKPFYYYIDKNRFIFASEIPAILSILKNRPAPDEQSIFEYLVFNRTDQTDSTFYSGVKKLQHGHCMKVVDEQFYKQILSYSIVENRIIINKWYDLNDRVEKADGFRSSEEYRETFRSAVGIRLRSDVPIGVCLSGGLDSSSIVSVIVNDFNKKDLQTFSVIYGDHIKTDEYKYMKCFKNDIFGMNFNKIDQNDYIKNIDDFIKAMAEPVPTGGPFAQYNVFKIAKSKAVVLLDGQGADETLGGYSYFWGYFLMDLLKMAKVSAFYKEIKNNDEKKFILKSLLFFMMPSKIQTYAKYRDSKIVKSDYYSAYKNNSIISKDLLTAKSFRQSLFNHVEYKLEHLLKWEDRNSMSFSLESRVPFLDYRLVEKTLATNTDALMNNGYTKVILRRALKDILPNQIVIRKDKIGFGAPQELWFRNLEVMKLINNIISEIDHPIWRYLDKKRYTYLWNAHIKRNINYGNHLWKLINLYKWYNFNY